MLPNKCRNDGFFEPPPDFDIREREASPIIRLIADNGDEVLCRTIDMSEYYFKKTGSRRCLSMVNVEALIYRNESKRPIGYFIQHVFSAYGFAGNSSQVLENADMAAFGAYDLFTDIRNGSINNLWDILRNVGSVVELHRIEMLPAFQGKQSWIYAMQAVNTHLNSLYIPGLIAVKPFPLQYNQSRVMPEADLINKVGAIYERALGVRFFGEGASYMIAGVKDSTFLKVFGDKFMVAIHPNRKTNPKIFSF